MMENGRNQRYAGWGRPQSHPIVSGYPLQSLEYAPPSSNQYTTSLESRPGDHRWIARPELNAPLSGGLTPFTPRHDSYPSRPFFGTLSSQESALVTPLRQADSPLSPDYNSTSRIQDNPHIESRYNEWQWQHQAALGSSPSPFYLISPGPPYGASTFIAQSGSAFQDNLLSNWPIHQTPLSSRFETHGNLALQQSTALAFPVTCYSCSPDTIIQDMNALEVHHWTKHPPPPSSPDAWTPRKCLWKDCHLPNIFKTPRDWLKHANYVHQKGYRCSVPGCNAKPFGSQADVRRHFRTMHTAPRVCIKAGCQAPKRPNLCRKDKLDEHEAMWHGPLMCVVPGCPRRRVAGEDHGFSKHSKLEEHKRLKHRHYKYPEGGS